MTLPMPPDSPYGAPVSPQRYFLLVWDTMDIPLQQEFDSHVVITPTFDRLHIYGREVGSPYPEDAYSLIHLREIGRVMGEWFSVVVPEGELGSNALANLTEISAEEFSAAFVRGWQAKEES